MKDFRNYVIIGLAILVVYFAMSGNGNTVYQVKIDALENEKHEAIEKLFALKKKTKVDSLFLVDHLAQDSLDALNTERLETSLSKSRQDYKEAVGRNKVVFNYDQKKLDSAFRNWYPVTDSILKLHKFITGSLVSPNQD